MKDLIGEVVKIKGLDKQKMTVNKVEGLKVECIWFKDNILKNGWFDIDEIEEA